MNTKHVSIEEITIPCSFCKGTGKVIESQFIKKEKIFNRKRQDYITIIFKNDYYTQRIYVKKDKLFKVGSELIQMSIRGF